MRWVFSLLLFVVAYFVEAQTHVITNNSEQIITHHKIWSSIDKNLSVDEVINKDSLFKNINKEFLNLGTQHKYRWHKIKLENTVVNHQFVFEFGQTYLDTLQLYLVKENKVQRVFPVKGIHQKDFYKDSFLQNKPSFFYPLTIKQGEQIDLYFKSIVYDGPYRVKCKIRTLDSYKERQDEIAVNSTFVIFFGGFVALVIVLGIAMFFFTYQRLYLYYIGFVIVIFTNLMAVRRFINPLFFEKYFFLGNNYSEMYGLIQVVFMIQYTNHYFSFKIEHKKLYHFLKKISVVTSIVFVLSLFLRQFRAFELFVFSYTKVLMIAMVFGVYGYAIYLCFKKNIMAIYYVVAYLPLVEFVIHFVMTALKLTSSRNPVPWEFVLFVEIFVLTLALAHKYYLMMKENLEYQYKIQEQRIQISRDLHDSIGSQLTFIISSISNLKYALKDSNEYVLKKLTDINEFSQVAIGQLRDTIWAMNRKEVLLNEFIDRIEAYSIKANDTNEKISVKFESFIKGNYTISSLTSVHLFRILQEAVNNAFKYSKGQEITVFLGENNIAVEILIKDNGVGFNLDEVELGNGLNNMKSRADECLANLVITSSLNEGTLVRLSIPKNTMNEVV